MRSEPAPASTPIVSEADIAAFRDDGVVCLRGVLSPEWTERMQAPVANAMCAPETVDMTTMATALDDSHATGKGRFFAGTDHWLRDDEFLAFGTETPLAQVAAELLGSAKIWLYEDSILVKEAGSSERTSFHQDLGYFHVDGEQVATIWCPLDPVTTENGALGFVRGSHLWGKDFKPNLFVSDTPIPHTEGADLPDVDAAPGDYEIISFDMEPGDITVHQGRTLHGSPPNLSESVARRVISMRFCGDDTRYRRKPGVPQKEHHTVADGASLDASEGLPLAFPVR